MNRDKHLQLNNRGFSFIEIVVALLILAIIVVPLFNIFSGAARTNRVNRMNSDADTIAQNVMEAIKVYGLEGTAKEVNSNKTGPNCMGVKCSEAEDTSSVETYNLSLSKFVQTDDHKYKYQLKNVKEGDDGSTYNVSISFDTEYTDKDSNDVNVRDLYDVSAFARESTVFFNPLAGNNYLDEMILKNLSEENKTMIDLEYMQAEKAWSDGGHHGTPPNREAYTARYMFPAGFVNRVNREMSIEVTEKPNPETGMNGYSIEADMRYILKNSDPESYTLEPIVPVYYESGDSGEVIKEIPLCTDSFIKGETVEKDYSFVEEGTVNKQLALYVFYTPYPYMCEASFDKDRYNELQTAQATDLSGEAKRIYLPEHILAGTGTLQTISFVHNSVRIVNDTNIDLEVYLVIQHGDKIDYLNKLETNVFSSKGKTVKLFSQAGLDIDGDLAYVQSDSGIINLKEDVRQEDLVNVTIEVYDEDGERIRTITSTIQQ